MVQRSAMRNEKRSRTNVGTMSLEGFWVAAMTIMPAARPLEIRSRSVSAEMFPLTIFMPFSH